MLEHVTSVPRSVSRLPSLPGLPRNPKLLVASVVVALSLGYLLLMGTQTAAVYYVTPTELVEQAAPVDGRLIRVGARVVDGSIERDDRTLTLRFRLSDRPRDGTGGSEVPVTYRGVVPDLFGYARDGYYQDVVVEGRYTRAGVLEASRLLVSHGALVEADAQTSNRGAAPSPWQSGSSN